MAPADVYYGRREEILKPGKPQKDETLDRRFQYNNIDTNPTLRDL